MRVKIRIKKRTKPTRLTVTIKYASLVASFLLLSAFKALAATPDDNTICRMPAYYTHPEQVNQMSMPVCPSQTREFGFQAARLDSGQAAVPIDAYGQCYYFDNANSDAYFVPMRTAEEYLSFVRNTPAGVHKVSCCRPKAITSSCGESIVLDYGRNATYQQKTVGSAEERVEQYGCMNGEWQMVWTNNQPCTASEADTQPTTISTQGWATERHFNATPAWH